MNYEQFQDSRYDGWGDDDEYLYDDDDDYEDGYLDDDDGPHYEGIYLQPELTLRNVLKKWARQIASRWYNWRHHEDIHDIPF